jgi:hypothetical protein
MRGLLMLSPGTCAESRSCGATRSVTTSWRLPRSRRFGRRTRTRRSRSWGRRGTRGSSTAVRARWTTWTWCPRCPGWPGSPRTARPPPSCRGSSRRPGRGASTSPSSCRRPGRRHRDGRAVLVRQRPHRRALHPHPAPGPAQLDLDVLTVSTANAGPPPCATCGAISPTCRSTRHGGPPRRRRGPAV